jgi:hypothetical protein
VHKNIPGLLPVGSNLTDLGRTVSLNHANDRRVVSLLKRKGLKFAQTTLHFICQSPDPNRNFYL